MRILRFERAIWLLPVLILSSPMLLPLAGRDRSKPIKANERIESSEITSIVDRIIATERQSNQKLKEYSPRVETYIQYYQPDTELGDTARKDDYYLGRLRFDSGHAKIDQHGSESSFIPVTSIHGSRLHPARRTFIYPDRFAVEALVVDTNNFDRTHYTFDPVRWEYLGDVRCLAIDVHPRGRPIVGAFEGRIWVEDHNYAIVRLNGTRVHPPHFGYYDHFDSWRENLQPGVWLPVYIYSQKSDFGGRFRYKSDTRLWGYDLSAHPEQQAWTNILVEAPVPIRDSTDRTSDLSPVESQRQVTIEAERNVLDRLEKARLIAPPGPVDKVLETVINNLRVTNHLENMPPVQCRVMLTSTLESFSLAYTIVLSRGLIDVLPDEASLAMILSHELANIALGHKPDGIYSFNDLLQVSDEELLDSLEVARDPQEEAAADAKAIEFLKNSPYKDNLGQAGLFLRAATAAVPNVPHLFGAKLGNGLTDGKKLIRMAELVNGAPALSPRSVDQIAVLPMNSRLQVNPWDGSVDFTTRKPVPLVDATEKLPFRVTPVIPYLRTYVQATKVQASAQN